MRRCVIFAKIFCLYLSSSYICHNYVHSRMHHSFQNMSTPYWDSIDKIDKCAYHINLN